MKINKLNSIIILGFIAIIGILIAQLLWTKEAFTIEEKKFSQKAHIALLEVAKELYEGTTNLPTENPIEKVSNDYYIVNVNNDFEPDVLEFYLKKEFKKRDLTTDFEYAMYDCQSDEMVYGNYISFSDNGTKQTTDFFPKHKNLVYYFAIRFPHETNYLFSSLKFWFILSFVLIVILLIYVYSIFTILQQKKYSELQRDFINNMTHEFKTPLSSILIASNYLHKQESISKDEKLEKYTQIIINQSNKLNNHIEKILNTAKRDTFPMRLEKEKIPVVKNIEDVIENIKLKYEFSNITIQTSIEEVCIKADKFHFSNLIYNILDNSIKYCEGNPEITINVSMTFTHLVIKFIDNGIGISKKDLPFIFDKFYRISSKKSNEVNGFGLGLYYVKKICMQHKWKISATNNLETGITITILLPAIDVQLK